MAQNDELSYHPHPQALGWPILPSIYLLELMQGLVLRSSTRSVSVTRGGSRISQRSFGEDLMMMVSQKPEALN